MSTINIWAMRGLAGAIALRVHPQWCGQIEQAGRIVWRGAVEMWTPELGMHMQWAELGSASLEYLEFLYQLGPLARERSIRRLVTSLRLSHAAAAEIARNSSQ